MRNSPALTGSLSDDRVRQLRSAGADQSRDADDLARRGLRS